MRPDDGSTSGWKMGESNVTMGGAFGYEEGIVRVRWRTAPA